MIQLYHPYDPKAPHGLHQWNFCYLHGKAECSHPKHLGTDDRFYASVPVPTQEGEYLCELYGKRVVAVLRYSTWTIDGKPCMCGRLALIDDTEALTHCYRNEDWR